MELTEENTANGMSVPYRTNHRRLYDVSAKNIREEAPVMGVPGSKWSVEQLVVLHPSLSRVTLLVDGDDSKVIQQNCSGMK